MIVGAGLVLVQGVWYKVGLFLLAAFIELSVAIMLHDLDLNVLCKYTVSIWV